MKEHWTPKDVIDRIAEVSEGAAWQAGVGACEMAGMIVSVLSEHPDIIGPFLEDGTGTLIDCDLMRWEYGRLTFMGQDGKVHTPDELLEQRRAKQARNRKKK